MSDLYSVIGTSNYTNLLADPQGADVIAVPLEPGNGELKRGMLLYRKSNGFWAPAATAQMSDSYDLVVLNEDVDTGDSISANSVAEDAAAYRAGRFIDGAVKYYNTSATEYQAVTAAIKLVLRQFGIVFNVKEGAAEFDNGTYKITYVANNSADPAEADVVKIKLAGATHTVLNNSDASLSFTAPATKSFSKWNTKADGTGTDYAAAATYSTAADLKLYAVWAS